MLLRAAVRPALTRLATVAPARPPGAVRCAASMGSTGVTYSKPVVFAPAAGGAATSTLLMLHGLVRDSMPMSDEGEPGEHQMNPCRRRRLLPAAAHPLALTGRHSRGLGRRRADAGARPTAHALRAAHGARAAHHAQRRCVPSVLAGMCNVAAARCQIDASVHTAAGRVASIEQGHSPRPAALLKPACPSCRPLPRLRRHGDDRLVRRCSAAPAAARTVGRGGRDQSASWFCKAPPPRPPLLKLLLNRTQPAPLRYDIQSLDKLKSETEDAAAMRESQRSVGSSRRVVSLRRRRCCVPLQGRDAAGPALLSLVPCSCHPSANCLLLPAATLRA